MISTADAVNEDCAAVPPPQPLRVWIQQPSLPAYRLALYQQLARLPGIRLSLRYGSEEPALRNVAPSGFSAEMTPFRTIHLGPIGPLFWHPSQWQVTSPRHADIAILCWNARFLSLLPALVRARIVGVPTALWGHGFSKAESSWRARLRWLPARLAKALIFYDFNTAQQWAQEGLAQDKIFVAPNGLDCDRIERASAPWREPDVPGDSRPDGPARGPLNTSQPTTPQPTTSRLNTPRLQRFRYQHGLSDGPIMIYIGRVKPQGRLDLVIAALAQLSRSHRQAQLVVIGTGEPVAALKRQASDLQVADRILWRGELYDEAAIAPWMLSADVMVYPRNVGLSLIHGFNYGLPGIACVPRQAHNPEIWALEDRVNGVLCDADAVSIADAVRLVVDDRSRHDSMRRAALNSARTTYNLGAVAATFERLIGYLGKR